jgi:hypothetical protein
MKQQPDLNALTPAQRENARNKHVITEILNQRHWPKLNARARDAIENPALDDADKTRALYAATAPLEKDMGAFSACRKGCSHCCHIAVAVNQAEAQIIGEHIGQLPEHPANRGMEGRDGFAEFVPLGYENPCPFLVDNQCSIYDVRPSACRLHFSLDISPDICKLDEARPVLLYGHINIDMLGVYAAGGPHDCVIADIREFFPKGKT